MYWGVSRSGRLLQPGTAGVDWDGWWHVPIRLAGVSVSKEVVGWLLVIYLANSGDCEWQISTAGLTGTAHLLRHILVESSVRARKMSIVVHMLFISSLMNLVNN